MLPFGSLRIYEALKNELSAELTCTELCACVCVRLCVCVAEERSGGGRPTRDVQEWRGDSPEISTGRRAASAQQLRNSANPSMEGAAPELQQYTLLSPELGTGLQFSWPNR